MPSTIRPNRTEVSRSFPVLGFTIRTSVPDTRFEVAIATDPTLFAPEAKPRRTTSNFYSTRASGPLRAERGDAVYLVSPPILARFVGADKLYYALATFRQADGANPEIVRLPPEAAPPVLISRSFTGTSRRVGANGGVAGHNGYGDAGGDGLSLEWAGDAAVPGRAEPLPASPATPAPAPAPAAPANGAARPGPAAGVASAEELAFEYDDGLGPMLAEPTPIDDEAEDEDHGINEPIPDTEPAPSAAGLVAALDGEVSEYPGASRFEPAHPNNYRRHPSARRIDYIVIHITDGGRSIEGPISEFKNPKKKASAHYVVGQDGEVVQMVHHDDVAWHAHKINSHSIGIEHVANTHGLAPTQAEYEASAALVRWLCGQFKVPIDRQHVVGHSEIDLDTTHTCPNPVWDWTTYMDLLTRPASDAGLAAGALGTERIDVRWSDVELVPQLTNYSCWAAAAAMVVGWRDRVSINPARIAAGEGIPPEAYQHGLSTNNTDELARAWGLVAEPPLCYTPAGFARLLEQMGPLWVDAAVPTGHAVTVIGMSGDGTHAGTTVVYHDPWPPGSGRAAEAKTFQQFMSEYEAYATTDPSGNVNVQVLHGNGRRPVGGQAQAVALGGQSFDINWNDVELLAQTKSNNCWATAAAMVAGWATRTSFPILDTPVPASLEEAAARFGLEVEPPQSFPVEEVRRLLETRGPLWASADQPFGASTSFHAVVITGMYGDGAPDGSGTYLYVLDPWDRVPGTPGHPGPHTGTHNQGSRYTVSWQQFLDELEMAVRQRPGWMWVRFMHARDTDNRSPGLGGWGTAQSLAEPAAEAPVTEIAGAAVTRVTGTHDGVQWELDQLRGRKRPHDDPAQEGTDAWRQEVTRVDGPHAWTASAPEHTYADFELRWQWNGRSLGEVSITPLTAGHAPAAGLRVKALIGDESQVYRRRGQDGDTTAAALHVQFAYDFAFPAGDTHHADTCITLYGNGLMDRLSRWSS